ncbi:MAG: hypothetical protein JWL77_4006 [Chthonomonadaceae bacterium]|nr:hypothetical protein [Chthonomonadaceae bacterium]
MVLNYYGVVDSEEGLLLFGDANTLHHWRGLENEQAQVDQIEVILESGQPGLNISIEDGMGVIWEMEGAGTTDVFISDIAEDIMLVRVWLEGSEDSESETQIITDFSVTPVASNPVFAEFEVRSGCLGILAPSESGECINSQDSIHYFLSVEDMATESSGTLLPCANGRYQCFHDSVQLGSAEARRCYITRVR